MFRTLILGYLCKLLLCTTHNNIGREQSSALMAGAYIMNGSYTDIRITINTENVILLVAITSLVLCLSSIVTFVANNPSTN